MIKQKNPGASLGEIGKRAGELWKALDDKSVRLQAIRLSCDVSCDWPCPSLGVGGESQAGQERLRQSHARVQGRWVPSSVQVSGDEGACLAPSTTGSDCFSFPQVSQETDKGLGSQGVKGRGEG